jgi:hypothetical protein
MQSDGGLTVGEKYSGLKAILSGPAGGVVAIASTCYDPEEGTLIIGFDMVSCVVVKGFRLTRIGRDQHTCLEI